MASFKILEDENTTSVGGFHHEAKNNKRHVLGDIQNNINRPFASLKRTIVNESCNSVPSGVIENIKALGLKDKPNVCQSEKVVSKSPLKDVKNLKSPLKDFKNLKSQIEVENDFSEKENVYKISSSSATVEIRETRSLEDETTNSSFPDISKESAAPAKNEKKSDSSPELSDENSTGSETPQISRLEISRNILDDLHCRSYYKEDIFNYLQTIEKKFQPSAYYMRRQPQITHSMRTILVDWLVEVGEEYNLSNETLFMSVALTDRFLSFMAITKAKLQLLGTAAMMAASKFEEIYPPEAGAFVYITDDSYTVNQLVRMERLLLKVLQFDVSAPTIYSFLTIIFSCEKVVTKIYYLAMYIAELTLLEAEPYLEYYPSMIASGAVVLARHCLDCKDIWPASHVKLTGYTLSQLVPVINHLNETHRLSFTSNHQAMRQKYSSAKYRCASQIPFRKLTLRES